MMVFCFVPNCKHYSEKNICKWFGFPTDPKLLKKWTVLISRKDKEPTKASRICSCHFVDEDRNNGPTLFEDSEAKHYLDRLGRPPKVLKKAVSDTVEEIQGSTSTTTAPASTIQLAAKNSFLQQELAKAKTEIKSLKAFSYRHFKASDNKLLLCHRKRPHDTRDETRLTKTNFDGIILTSNAFTVKMNVQDFKPEEVSVTVNGNVVIIDAKHDEKSEGNGLVSRHIVKKYTIPKGFDVDEISESMSDEGQLAISVPKFEEKPEVQQL